VLQGALACAERIFDLLALEPDDYREELATDAKLERLKLNSKMSGWRTITKNGVL
jgi:hypothetical protein